MEPLERTIFDHRILCNSGSSVSEAGSGKVGKWGKPEIDRAASLLHPRWETVLHTGARQSPGVRNEPRFRAALDTSQRPRRPYTHNRARQHPDWPEPGNAPATMCSNTRAPPGVKARSYSPDSATLGPVGLKRLVRPGGSSARRVPRLPAPQSTACMDRAACRTRTPRPAVPGLQTARSVWSARSLLPLSNTQHSPRAPASWTHSIRFAKFQRHRRTPHRVVGRWPTTLPGLILAARTLPVPRHPQAALRFHTTV